MKFLWWLSGKGSKTTQEQTETECDLSDEDSYSSSSEEDSCISPVTQSEDDQSLSLSTSPESSSPVNLVENICTQSASCTSPTPLNTMNILSSLDNVSDTDSDSESSSTNFDIFYRKYGNVDLEREEVKLIYDAMDKLDYRDQFPTRMRYIDYKRMIKHVKREKLRNSGSILQGVARGCTIETYPPIHKYNYTFNCDEVKSVNRGFEDTFYNFYDKYCKNDHTMTENEYKIVYKALDRTDYTKRFPNEDRYIDLSNVVKKIHYLKSKNGGRELVAIKLLRVTESYPPHRVYDYYFAKH